MNSVSNNNGNVIHTNIPSIHLNNIYKRQRPAPYYILNNYSNDWDFDIDKAKEYFKKFIDNFILEYTNKILDKTNFLNEIYYQKYKEALEILNGNLSLESSSLLINEAQIRNISVEELANIVISKYKDGFLVKSKIELVRIELKQFIEKSNSEDEMKFIVSTLVNRLKVIIE